MESILEVHPAIVGTPTMPLKYAVDKLKEVAEEERQAGINLAQRRNDTVRNRYYTSLHLAPLPITVDQFEARARQKITSTYGKKGPTENAFNEVKQFARRAYTAGYLLDSPRVLDAFVNFLMLYVTEGFVGVDNTGTQMGNHQGGWRGGGFSN